MTVRHPPHAYLHLTLVTADGTPAAALDAITARTHLNSALHRFLGLTGAAIPLDILQLRAGHVWIRVPRPDGRAVVEAASGWVGDGVAWRVRGRGVWLGGLVGGGRGGRAVFEGLGGD
jgi:ribonuclease P/MRP protein subunit POP8